MKLFATTILATFLTVLLTACGCSNSALTDTTTPNSTMIPDILPTIETNIPDPEVDTEMPIYTNGTTEPDTMPLPDSTLTEQAK